MQGGDYAILLSMCQLGERGELFLANLDLHYFIRPADNATYTPKGFVDSEDSSVNVTVRKWRKNSDANGIVNLPNVRGSSILRTLYQ